MDEDKLHKLRFLLRVRGGEKHGRIYEIPPKGFVVGRAAGCDLILDSSMVSRQHARFHLKHGHCYVEDMGSRNGIQVNGKRVSKRLIRSGDEVDFGCCSLVLRVEGSLTERPRSEKLIQLLDNISALERRRASAQVVASRQPALHPFAIAAAIFAALACVFWAFALGAVLLSVLALVEIRSQQEHRGALLAGAALAFGLAGAFINAWPHVQITLPRRQSDPLALECKSNLKLIGAALRRYALDHDGRYPPSLQELAPAYVAWHALSCPAAAKQGRGHGGYAFHYADVPNVPQQAPVVHDASADNHEGRGGFVLYASGEVRWMKAPEFVEFVASFEGE